MYGERLSEAIRQYDGMSEELKTHVQAIKLRIEEQYKASVDSMSLHDMTGFNKAECHHDLFTQMRESASELVPDLVLESQAFFLSNAVNNDVQAVQRCLGLDRSSRRNKLVDMVFTPVNAIRRRLRHSLSPSQSTDNDLVGTQWQFRFTHGTAPHPRR